MISRRKGFLILGLIFGGFLGSLAFLLSGDTEYKDQPTFAEIDAPFTIIDFRGTVFFFKASKEVLVQNLVHERRFT